MNKLVALLLTLLFILIISNQITVFSILESKEAEEVTISRVIDGDTVVLKDGRTLRLVNINAPEKISPLSRSATEFLKKYENSSVKIITLGTDKYYRVLARIYTPEYLNEKLVEKGLASKFLVQSDEIKNFAIKENNAINNGEGIWKHSKYWECFILKVNSEKEIVLIEKICNVSLRYFYIKDESRKIYKFQNSMSLKVNLHTYNGSDNTTDLFWNLKDSVWNDDRDSVYLFDSQDNLAGYYSYGYL